MQNQKPLLYRTSTDQKPVLCSSSTDQKPLLCRTSTDQKPLLCRTSTDQKSVLCRTRTDQKPVLCITSTDKKPVLCRTSTDKKPVLCSSSTDKKPVMCSSNTDQSFFVFCSSISPTCKEFTIGIPLRGIKRCNCAQWLLPLAQISLHGIALKLRTRKQLNIREIARNTRNCEQWNWFAKAFPSKNQ